MTMPKFEPVGYLDADGYYRYTNTSRRDIAPLYTADQLTEAYEAGKQDQAAELEAARAEIERLENQVQARDAELWGRTQKILQLEQQLAAEQAKNVGLRELVEHFALIDLGRSLLPCDFGLWVLRARKAIATPSDTSALETIIKKAGEVMRERCASESCRSHEYDATKAIRTLPAVTLEDLK